MKKKLKLALVCIPLYPICMISEWYESRVVYGDRDFSFIKTTKEYWSELFRYFKKG